jgi:hypothetical protein
VIPEFSVTEEQDVIDANDTLKTCCECFFIQPIGSYCCALCGVVPFYWIAAKEYPANPEMDGLRKLASKADVEQLQELLESNWAYYTPERERVVLNLLAVRQRQREVQEAREHYERTLAAFDRK